MNPFVRILVMASAGAALLAMTALSYPGWRSAVAAPQSTLAHLSSSAVRTVTAHMFQKTRAHRDDLACSPGHHDA